MKKIKDLPKKERPREKLLEKGARTLSDQELLAVMLGRGTQNNANRARWHIKYWQRRRSINGYKRRVALRLKLISKRFSNKYLNRPA